MFWDNFKIPKDIAESKPSTVHLFHWHNFPCRLEHFTCTPWCQSRSTTSASTSTMTPGGSVAYIKHFRESEWVNTNYKNCVDETKVIGLMANTLRGVGTRLWRLAKTTKRRPKTFWLLCSKARSLAHKLFAVHCCKTYNYVKPIINGSLPTESERIAICIYYIWIEYEVQVWENWMTWKHIHLKGWLQYGQNCCSSFIVNLQFPIQSW